MMLQHDEMPLLECWFELVMAWRAFEEKAGYQKDGYLNSVGQPPCIGLWIGHHYSVTWRPVLPKPLVFEKQFHN